MRSRRGGRQTLGDFCLVDEREHRRFCIGTAYHRLAIQAESADSHSPSVLVADFAEGVADLAEGAKVDGIEQLGYFAERRADGAGGAPSPARGKGSG